jgi:N-acetylmuramoyl-L-alanine amidase
MRHRSNLIFALAFTLLLTLPVAVRPVPADAASLSCGICSATTLADLNLRDSPSLSASVLLVMPAGSNVTWDATQGNSDGFVAITYDGVSGWAHSDYLDLQANRTAPGFPIGSSVMVNTTILNMRALAMLGSNVIGVLPYGTQGTVLEPPIPVDGYLWHRVDFGPTYGAGWVAGELLIQTSDNGGFVIGDTVVVTSGPLNYRAEPTIGASVLEVLAVGIEGAIVDGPIYQSGYTWYQLGLPGYGPDGAAPGWVAGEFLSRR